LEVPVQTVPLPLIAPGVVSGDSTVTDRLDADVVPQVFVAVTVRVPPAGPAVAVMELSVGVPVQPFGNVQV
jgi:hypothetical protein